MILTFAKEQFKNKILAGIKIHTIREDKNRRWRPGMKAQLWLHSPRHVSKHPHQFAEKEVTSVQRIMITSDVRLVSVRCDNGMWVCLKYWEIEELAKNDGFESVGQFWKWFDKPMDGVIVHWTEKIYG